MSITNRCRSAPIRQAIGSSPRILCQRRLLMCWSAQDCTRGTNRSGEGGVPRRVVPRSHLAKVASILDDPEASANDRGVPLALLRNAAKGQRVLRPASGRRVIMGHHPATEIRTFLRQPAGGVISIEDSQAIHAVPTSVIARPEIFRTTRYCKAANSITIRQFLWPMSKLCVIFGRACDCPGENTSTCDPVRRVLGKGVLFHATGRWTSTRNPMV